MKTTKQKKEKTVVGCSGVKKTTNRGGGRFQRTAGGNKSILAEDDPGALPFSAAQVVIQQLARSDSPSCEREIPQSGLRPSEKIKLQLFPIDEGTRVGLEKDGHNPFLELTLRARKKISSVLKRLNIKWVGSSVALGEPILFPYNIQSKELCTYNSWRLSDCDISAGDVYAAIGSPVVFRLRYGWCSNLDPQKVAIPSRSHGFGTCFESEGLCNGRSSVSVHMDDRKEKLRMTSDDFTPVYRKNAADGVVDSVDTKVKMDNDLARSIVPWEDSLTNLSVGGLLSEASLQGKLSNFDPMSEGSKLNMHQIQLISSDISIGGLLSEASLQGKIDYYEPKSDGGKLGLQPIVDKGVIQSSVTGDDSLTNLSIGGLLSEASLSGKFDTCDPKSNGSKVELQPDSLDAFIAAQLNSQPHASTPSLDVSHSSILDAEETCHAFSFRKLSSSCKDDVPLGGSATPGNCNHNLSSKSFILSDSTKINGQGALGQDPFPQESKTELLTHFGENHDESSFGLAGIKWTESLGPFGLGMSTSRQITSGDCVSISELVR